MPSSLKRFLKIEVIMICLGAFAGFGLLFIPAAFLGSWERISQVTGTPARIVYGYPQFYVETQNQLIYACSSHERQCNPIASYDPPPDFSQYNLCGKPDSRTPAHPGLVVTSLTYRECAADGYVDIYIVGLEDGTIWEWWNFQGGQGAAEIPFFLAQAGAIIGAVLGIPLNLILFFVRRRTMGKAKRSV
jgi:hypothetical protein